MRWILNCGHCGRFVRADKADWYTPWGGAADLEPPDPVMLCRACAETRYREVLGHILSRGLAPYDARGAWRPGGYWFRARAVARAMWRHGLAERPALHMRARHEISGVRQIRWCRDCGRPEGHPAHAGWQTARRVGVAFCPNQAGSGFRWTQAKNIGRTKVQEWCTCGWTTGPHPPGTGHPRLVDSLTAGVLLREHMREATGRPDHLHDLVGAA